jgi:hypothetical protein
VSYCHLNISNRLKKCLAGACATGFIARIHFLLDMEKAIFLCLHYVLRRSDDGRGRFLRGAWHFTPVAVPWRN